MRRGFHENRSEVYPMYTERGSRVERKQIAFLYSLCYRTYAFGWDVRQNRVAERGVLEVRWVPISLIYFRCGYRDRFWRARSAKCVGPNKTKPAIQRSVLVQWVNIWNTWYLVSLNNMTWLLQIHPMSR